MTLLVTISANTAALAMESLRPGRRVSTKDQVTDMKADAERNARRAENAGDPGDGEFLIPPTTVSIDLLTTGDRPRQQATLNQAQSAYRYFEE